MKVKEFIDALNKPDLLERELRDTENVPVLGVEPVIMRGGAVTLIFTSGKDPVEGTVEKM